jgi:hypothetical protein
MLFLLSLGTCVTNATVFNMKLYYKIALYLLRQSVSGPQGFAEFGSHSQGVMLERSISVTRTLPTALLLLIFTYIGGFCKQIH